MVEGDRPEYYWWFQINLRVWQHFQWVYMFLITSVYSEEDFRKKYVLSCRYIWKEREMKVAMIQILVGTLWTVPKGLEKRKKEIGKQGKT